MPKIEFLSTAAMAQVFACRGPPLFFAIATSLLPVLGVFHLIYSNRPHQMLGLQACLLPHENSNSKQARD